jgi:hypothetical protein
MVAGLECKSQIENHMQYPKASRSLLNGSFLGIDDWSFWRE